MLLLSRFGRFGNVCTTDRDWLVQVVEEQLASLRAELRSAHEEVAGERAAAAAALADAERRIGTNQPRHVLIWSLALLDCRCWTGMVGAVHAKLLLTLIVARQSRSVSFRRSAPVPQPRPPVSTPRRIHRRQRRGPRHWRPRWR